MKRYIRADIVDIWEEPYDIRMAAAKNWEASPRTLMRLAEHEYDYSILGQVAINPNTPVEALKLLAKSPFAGVRAYVAKNPNTPSELLVRMYNKEAVTSTAPLCAIAANQNTPPKILAKLADHFDEIVRSNVAKNPNIPENALDKLSNDVMFAVQEAATYNPNCKNPEAILDFLGSQTQYTREQRRTLASNPKTSLALLTRLADDRDSVTQGFVAKHTNIPTSLLEKLSKSKYGFVQHCVAKNPNTPTYILVNLSKHAEEINDEWGLADDIIAHPNTPVAIIEKFAQSEDDLIRRGAELRLQELNRNR